VKTPTRSNPTLRTKAKSSSKSSSVSPGKPVMNVVRTAMPGTRSRTRLIKRSRLSRLPPRRISFKTFCEACCKGMSRYLTAFGSEARTSKKASLMCVG
jgi:hypothetical protein